MRAQFNACAIQCGPDDFFIETSSQTPLLEIDGLRDVKHKGMTCYSSPDYMIPRPNETIEVDSSLSK
jgi:hypothetical protein